MHGTNYVSTFIAVAEDCAASAWTPPMGRTLIHIFHARHDPNKRQ